MKMADWVAASDTRHRRMMGCMAEVLVDAAAFFGGACLGSCVAGMGTGFGVAGAGGMAGRMAAAFGGRSGKGS